MFLFNNISYKAFSLFSLLKIIINITFYNLNIAPIFCMLNIVSLYVKFEWRSAIIKKKLNVYKSIVTHIFTIYNR